MRVVRTGVTRPGVVQVLPRHHADPDQSGGPPAGKGPDAAANASGRVRGRVGFRVTSTPRSRGRGSQNGAMARIPSGVTTANALEVTQEPPFFTAPRSAARFVGTERGAVNVLKGEGPGDSRSHVTDGAARRGGVRAFGCELPGRRPRHRDRGAARIRKHVTQPTRTSGNSRDRHLEHTSSRHTRVRLLVWWQFPRGFRPGSSARAAGIVGALFLSQIHKECTHDAQSPVCRVHADPGSPGRPRSCSRRGLPAPAPGRVAGPGRGSGPPP